MIKRSVAFRSAQPAVISSLCVMAFLGASDAHAQTYEKWVMQCANLPTDQQIAACVKALTAGLDKPKPNDQKKWDAVTQTELAEANEKFVFANDEKKAYKLAHANDHLFLRQTTDLGKENKAPAQLTLTRTDGQTVGVARAALIHVNAEGLVKALNLDKKKQKLYYGVGLHRDDTDATKRIFTTDLRLGYRHGFHVRQEDTPGVEQVSWISLTRLNNHVANTAQLQTEVGYDWSYRWFEADKFDRIKFDRQVNIKINPFSDHTIKDPTGLKPTTTGVGLGLDFSWYKPTDVAWVPKAGKPYLPDRWNFSTLRNVSTGATKQYSTINKLGFTWELARSEVDSLQPSLTLAREVGGNFREGIVPTAKTLLTLNVKYN